MPPHFIRVKGEERWEAGSWLSISPSAVFFNRFVTSLSLGPPVTADCKDQLEVNLKGSRLTNSSLSERINELQEYLAQSSFKALSCFSMFFSCRYLDQNPGRFLMTLDFRNNPDINDEGLESSLDQAMMINQDSMNYSTLILLNCFIHLHWTLH